MAANVHRQWERFDLSLIGRELSAVLATPPLDLLHAWGNVVYGDDTYVYKLAAPAGRDRCDRSLRALAEIFAADPEFPTVPPVSSHAEDIDLGATGSWVLTVWPRLSLTPVIPTADETEPYRELGQIVRRLHSIQVSGCSRHDPLVWALARARTLPVPALRESLESEAEQLERTYAEVFPAEAFVTVHGDLHWEQIVRDERGQLLLLDFEHVATGPASVDLVPSAGWLRRSGHPSDAQTAALAAGYGDGFPVLTAQQASVVDEIARFSRKTWELLHPQR